MFLYAGYSSPRIDALLVRLDADKLHLHGVLLRAQQRSVSVPVRGTSMLTIPRSIRQLVLCRVEHSAIRPRCWNGERPHDRADVPHGRADNNVQERSPGH